MQPTYNDYRECIEVCLSCADKCDNCANLCSNEKSEKMMATCIQLAMECTTICYATAKLVSLGSNHIKDACTLCASICLECANECEKYDTEYCQMCAKICRQCAEQCSKVAGFY